MEKPEKKCSKCGGPGHCRPTHHTCPFYKKREPKPKQPQPSPFQAGDMGDFFNAFFASDASFSSTFSNYAKTGKCSSSAESADSTSTSNNVRSNTTQPNVGKGSTSSTQPNVGKGSASQSSSTQPNVGKGSQPKVGKGSTSSARAKYIPTNLVDESAKQQDKFFNTDNISSDSMLNTSDIPYPNKTWIAKQMRTGCEAAYKQLAKRWHPDSFMNKFCKRINPDDKQNILKSVTAAFQLISEEYKYYKKYIQINPTTSKLFK